MTAPKKFPKDETEKYKWQDFSKENLRDSATYDFESTQNLKYLKHFQCLFSETFPIRLQGFEFRISPKPFDS